MSPAALGVVLRETVRRNRVRDGIVYLQVTRGVARRDHAFPAAGTAPGIVVTARVARPGARGESIAAEGIAVITVPDNRWARLDIKSVSLLPNVLAKQAAREQGAREAWFVDAKGFVTEGASSNAWIVTAGRQGRDAAGRPQHPERHFPHRGARGHRGPGAHAGGARLHGRGGLGGPRGLRDRREPDRPAGGADRRQAGRQTAVRARSRRRCGANSTATPS